MWGRGRSCFREEVKTWGKKIFLGNMLARGPGRGMEAGKAGDTKGPGQVPRLTWGW